MTSTRLLEGGTDKRLTEGGASYVLEDHVPATGGGGGTTWSDTDFININSGGAYATAAAYGTDTWNTATPGQISEQYGFGWMVSFRNDVATGKDQRVKISVTEVNAGWQLAVRAPAAPDSSGYGGYKVQKTGTQAYFYYGSTFFGNPDIIWPTGPGTVEWVSTGDVCKLYVNDALIYTRDFSTVAITTDDAHQGIGLGSDTTTAITYAEGGDVGGSAPFTPSSITGLNAWLDASDASTFTLSGTNVSAWRDKSGALHHFAPGGTPPTRVGTLNGLNIVDFASGGPMYPNASAPGGVATTATAQPVTVAVVTRLRGTGWGGVVAGTTSNAQIRRWGATGTDVSFDAGASQQYPLDSTYYHVLVGVFNGASSVQRIDSVQVGTANTGTNGWTAPNLPRIGSDDDNNAFDGQIAEMTVYNKALSPAEITSLESYLTTKWFPAPVPIDYDFTVMADGPMPAGLTQYAGFEVDPPAVVAGVLTCRSDWRFGVYTNETHTEEVLTAWTVIKYPTGTSPDIGFTNTGYTSYCGIRLDSGGTWLPIYQGGGSGGGTWTPPAAGTNMTIELQWTRATGAFVFKVNGVTAGTGTFSSNTGNTALTHAFVFTQGSGGIAKLDFTATGSAPTTTPVSASRSTTWTTKAVVTATRPTTWVTLAPVSATRPTTWNVASVLTAVAPATRTTTWNVIGRIVATRATTWNVLGILVQVTASRSTVWNVGTLLWKGVGVIPDGHVTADDTLLDVSWFYDWASRSVVGHEDDTSGLVQYVPMMWGDWINDPRWGSATGDGSLGGNPAASVGPSGILLGFNEPDDPGQSGVSVARALELWPQLEATGNLLGSPAPAMGGEAWLASFMSGNGGPVPRVDFICCHWYADYSGGRTLAQHLDYYHGVYPTKPIWLTEVCSLSGGDSTNQALIADVMTVLSTRSWVERVAWFSNRDTGTQNTGLVDTAGGTLNVAGTAYATYPERIPFSTLFSVATTRTTTWQVRTGVTTSKAATWLVNATVSTSRAATWTTRSIISTTRVATWDTKASVAATLRAASWNTLTTVSTPRTGIWTVRTSVSTAAATTWQVLVPVVGTVSRSTTWVVRSLVTTTRAALWNTLVPVAAAVSRATAWNTRANVATTGVATWDTKASVAAASRGASWAVLASVSTIRPTTWAVWVQVTKTAAALWNVNGTLIFVSTSRATTWVVRAFVSTSRVATWNTVQGVATSRVASWNVVGAAVSVSTSRATTWIVRQSITTTRAALWTVCTPVTATPKATTWRVLTTTTASARSTTWRVLAVVATSKAALWNVDGSMYTVATSRSTTWSTRALVSTTRPTSWAVNAAVATACLTIWRVSVTVAAQRSARWNVAAPISKVTVSRSTTWNVAPTAPVTDYLVLFPNTVMYLGENLIQAMYQGSVKIWPPTG